MSRSTDDTSSDSATRGDRGDRGDRRKDAPAMGDPVNDTPTLDDPYEGFAPVYDRWQWLHSAPFSAAMIVRMRQAVREWGVPERSLLDLACGTGTLAWWWSEENPDWTVVATDRSSSMIEHAQAGPARRLPTRRARPKKPATQRVPQFIVQDMTRTDLGRQFGMATCFFDSLNHVTKQSELSRILTRTRQSLLPEGLFLFDLIDEDSFADIFSSPWIVQGDGLFVGTESELFERRGSEYGRVRFTFFENPELHAPRNRNHDSAIAQGGGSVAGQDNRSHSSRYASSGPDAGWIRRESKILERCWRREEFDPMVAKAGLEIIHVQLIDPEEQEEVFVPRRLYVCRPLQA